MISLFSWMLLFGFSDSYSHAKRKDYSLKNVSFSHSIFIYISLIIIRLNILRTILWMIILSKKIANFQNSVRYGLSALPINYHCHKWILYQEHLYALPYHCLIVLKNIFMYVCVWTFSLILLIIWEKYHHVNFFNASFLRRKRKLSEFCKT